MINLIVDAVEAMAGAGGVDRELTIVSETNNANEVLFEVQDTGPGLDPAQLDRLFRSFYTTKPHGIGMGLAMALVQGERQRRTAQLEEAVARLGEAVAAFERA